MAIQFKAKNKDLSKNASSNGHTRPQAPLHSLEHDDARLRVCHFMSLLGVSHSTLYKGLQTGRYPPADGKDGSMPYWRAETVRNFLQG